MKPIIITRDIEKFIKLIEKVYYDIYSSLLNEIIGDLKTT